MTVIMLDTIGSTAGNIPTSTALVAGYVTGTSPVPWSQADWDKFPHSGHVRIDQTVGATDPLGSDVLDVENGAATPDHATTWVQERIKAGIKWSTIYGTFDTLTAVDKALRGAGGGGWYFGHVDCWYANWNLNETEAEHQLGVLIAGFTCRAVQWASPSSNPNTIVPGGTQTLAQSNIDISVAQDGWHTIAPPPPPPPAFHGMLITGGPTTYVSKLVTSADGKSWS